MRRIEPYPQTSPRIRGSPNAGVEKRQAQPVHCIQHNITRTPLEIPGKRISPFLLLSSQKFWPSLYSSAPRRKRHVPRVCNTLHDSSQDAVSLYFPCFNAMDGPKAEVIVAMAELSSVQL